MKSVQKRTEKKSCKFERKKKTKSTYESWSVAVGEPGNRSDRGGCVFCVFVFCSEKKGGGTSKEEEKTYSNWGKNQDPGLDKKEWTQQRGEKVRRLKCRATDRRANH